jgi:hypothetical protein
MPDVGFCIQSPIFMRVHLIIADVGKWPKAAPQKSRYGKGRGRFEGSAGAEQERRLILQQRAFPETGSMLAPSLM